MPHRSPPSSSSLADQARCLLRGRAVGALGTVDRASSGPYVSLVTYATTPEGLPIFLLSRLADHTRNLDIDQRVSLLVDATAGYANPQQGPRLTLQGGLARSVDPVDRARFLARHPAAALYVDFADFAFYRMTVTAGHWVGGFARAQWLFDGLQVAAPSLGEDRLEDLLPILATAMAEPAAGWQLTGWDADGLELSRGEEVRRFTFDAPQHDAEAVRQTVLAGKMRYWRN